MGKLSAEEVHALAIEAAKTIDSVNHPPYNRFDEETIAMYQKYIRAKEIIESEESKG